MSGNIQLFYMVVKSGESYFFLPGTNLRLEVNGKLVDEVTDSDIKSGSAHLFALSKSDVTADNPFRFRLITLRLPCLRYSRNQFPIILPNSVLK